MYRYIADKPPPPVSQEGPSFAADVRSSNLCQDAAGFRAQI